jgi:hypothetical protein
MVKGSKNTAEYTLVGVDGGRYVVVGSMSWTIGRIKEIGKKIHGVEMADVLEEKDIGRRSSSWIGDRNSVVLNTENWMIALRHGYTLS